MMNEDKVYEIIQRWHGTPEEDLKPEDHQVFKDIGASCVAGGDGEQLLKFVRDENNQGIVKSMGCGLLAPLVDEVVRKGKSRDHCQAAITQLTQTCSSRTLLQSFLEIVEDMDPGAISKTILVLLPHLQTVLLQLDENQAACLGLALSALQKQVSRLPVPYTQQQEEADEHGLCRCCMALATFTKTFIEGLRKDENWNSTTEEDQMKAEILKFCMKSLKDPLLEAQLSHDRKSSLQLFAEKIMVMLPAVKQSLSGLLFFSSLRKSPLMDASVSKESTACLAYLLFVRLITMDTFPAVFSPVFVVRCNMEHINQLLISKKESHLLKGLALFAKSLEKVEDNSLPVGLLDLKSFYSASRNLQKVLSDCPIQHLRESGLKVFQLLINKLDAEAKHKLFRCMLKTSHHAGVESYIVNNIRKQIYLSIKGDTNKWFLGTELLPLLELVLSLPQAAETDLLTNMDTIMESLNLLRFLLLRDKELRSNSDMWENLCQIKDKYLKMLRVCISMSRAYYSAEMKALMVDQKLKAKEARENARTTTLVKTIPVKHDKATSMSPEVEYQVLQSALVTFDLMESLTVRIDEIAEEKLGKPY